LTRRVTKPFRPQTNGLVERFNRGLAEAIAARTSVARNEGKNKFHTRAEREAFLLAGPFWGGRYPPPRITSSTNIA
jgi:hypothetical protein